VNSLIWAAAIAQIVKVESRPTAAGDPRLDAPNAGRAVAPSL